MLAIHEWVGVLAIGASVAAGAWALLAYWRPFGGHVLQHVIALTQTLIVAQLLFGLLLLAGSKRASEGMHYTYGTLAVIAILAPFLYAPSEPRSRLLWFGGACLLAATLTVRAYMTA